MNCEHCGAALRAEDKFCAGCGEQVRPPGTCPSCQFPVREGARYCIRCGTSVDHLMPAAGNPASAQRTSRSARPGPGGAPRLEPVLAGHRGAARPRAPAGAREAKRAPARAMHPAGPALLLVLALALGIVAYMMWSNQRDAFRSETRPASATDEAVAEKSALPGDAAAPAAASFSTSQALRAVYGNYDPNLDGAFWTVSGAPKAYAQWNGRSVFLRPLISRTFEQRGVRRHILVTNSLDVKDGLVVKQGAGCKTCPSLVGASVFEKRSQGWALISRHDFLTADGAWGAPPKVSVLLPARGGIELQFDRPAIDPRNPGRQYSIVLKDRTEPSERTARTP